MFYGGIDHRIEHLTAIAMSDLIAQRQDEPQICLILTWLYN